MRNIYKQHFQMLCFDDHVLSLRLQKIITLHCHVCFTVQLALVIINRKLQPIKMIQIVTDCFVSKYHWIFFAYLYHDINNDIFPSIKYGWFLMLFAYFYIFLNENNLTHNWKWIVGVKLLLVMLELYRTGTNTLSIFVSKNS